MDAVEVFLFCLVGLSVSVFLVVENFEKGRRKPHQHEEAEKALVSAVSSSVKEDYFPEGERAVGDHGEAVPQVDFCGGSTAIVREIEEEDGGERVKPSDREIPSEKSDLLPHSDGGGDKEKEEQEWFDDDDCEGVERSELEKVFGEAVVFVGCDENADQIGDEQRLELYGLQKVAFEGACRGPPPMLTALNASARSKWNSWQKVGGISREAAMERYVDVLSRAAPGWKMGS